MDEDGGSQWADEDGPQLRQTPALLELNWSRCQIDLEVDGLFVCTENHVFKLIMTRPCLGGQLSAVRSARPWIGLAPSTAESTAESTTEAQMCQGGLVFKARRLLYHSTLGLRVIKKKRRESGS